MQLKLLEKHDEAAGIKTFIFENSENIFWKAGQYFRYKIENPSPDEKGIQRYFTNAAAPYENRIQISTRFMDPISTFKQDLDKIAIGSTIQASGPFGDFTLEDPADHEFIFIAGGIGITPFRSILLQLDNNKKPFRITLIYANRDQNIIFNSEFSGILERNSGFQFITAIDPVRVDENFLNEKIPDLTNKIYYISGPEPMVKGVEDTLAKMGITEDKIKHDYFPGYDVI